MADKRISQLVDRGTVANNDVVPIVVSGAVTTNKATISSIQTFMQGNLDFGVTSVGITLGSSGTDVSVTGSPITTSGNITINIPTASASNRGLLSSADWSTFTNDRVPYTGATTNVDLGSNNLSSRNLIANGGFNTGALLLKNANNASLINTGYFTLTPSSTTTSINFGYSTGANTWKSFILSSHLLTDNSPTIFALPNGGGTLALTSDLSGYVTLGTAQTITAQKTITTNGGSDTFIVNHTSGNGIGVNITKGGNNEALRVAKTSGTGNAVTISGGLLSAEAATLTGALNGTSASFTGAVSATGLLQANDRLFVVGQTTPSNWISNALTAGYNTSGTQGWIQGAGSLALGTNGTTALTLASTGAATFSSSVTANGIKPQLLVNGDSLNGAGISLNTGLSGTDRRNWFIGTEENVAGDFTIKCSTAAGGNANAGDTRLAILNNGNVGIGTGSPDRRLTINSGASEGSLGLTSNNGVEIDMVGYGTGFSHPQARIKMDDAGFFGGNLSFWTKPNGAQNNALVERMRITSSGNVGIGVTPSAWSGIVRGFQVGQGASFSANTATTDAYMTSNCYYDGSTWRYIKSGEFALSYDARGGTGDYVWQTAPSGTAGSAFTFTERMRITSGGFLKASNNGTYYGSTGGYHEIRSSIEDWTNIVSNSNASPYGIFIQYTSASPNGISNEFFTCRDGGLTVRAVIRSNGGLSNYQANDTNLSDERVKKDIEPLESYWDKFKAIEIVKFKYKDQTHDDFNIGVIAQQVEAVAPEFVDVDGWENNPQVDEEGNPILDEEGNEIVSEEEPLKSIYTADLHHATIKVLQEAMIKIEELQEQINSLKNQIK